MKLLNTIVSFIVISIVIWGCSSDQRDTSIAQIYSPGNISTHMSERDAALSDNGKMFFFSLQLTRQHSAICYATKMNNKWIRPRVAEFSGKYMDIEPVFHPDGRLFFCSNRPLPNEETASDYNIWFVSHNNDGSWSDPQALDTIVNSEANEFYPSFTNNGDIYYTCSKLGGKGAEDLWTSKFENGNFQKAINLGDSINTANFEYNAFIHPNGNYLMFTSHGWGEGMGGGDLYISFRKDDGTWATPKNMGTKVNTSAFEFCPSLSPDGKTLFFTRRNTPVPEGDKWSYFEIMSSFNSLENGQGNIYSIDSDFIECLR